MKNNMKKIAIVIALATGFIGCSKFDEINTHPYNVNDELTQPEYFFNKSLTDAQQDPNIAERIFVLDWKTAGRQHLSSGLATGTVNDSWSAEYWKYSSQWHSNIHLAIQKAEGQLAENAAFDYTSNMLQVSRIWRAYLLTEISDNFGPMPIENSNGTNPVPSSTQDVYYYALAELKDAVDKLDVAVPTDDRIKKYDRAYQFSWEKWKRYGNSMRLRLAMRLSEVDLTKAKEEFEDAVRVGLFIEDASHNFTVAEKTGWDGLSGVMSRSWNSQVLPSTLNNIYIGLGGVPSSSLVGPSMQSYIKPENYIGKRYDKQFTSLTNDPSAGYWLDGLPNKIDPRAYKAFFIPGDFTNSNFLADNNEAKITTSYLVNAPGDTIKLDTKFTWNAFAIGSWGEKGSKNNMYNVLVGKLPALSQAFRASTSSRIFFANWETYFLLSEASLRGWNTGTTAQEAYEDGVKANFDYWDVSQYATQYLASEEFNRVGTSVKFTHTTEPGVGKQMNYIDGYTNANGTVTIPYPTNNLYQNGTVKNDALTKIITQKFIANLPWLPLESWNDHRRLGLPFFENPAIEVALTNMPDLTSSNYMTNSIKFYPQRLPYPSNFKSGSLEGYNTAVSHLGGPDNVFTPLWWAKQN
ncbi:SusD/RagB family nutrient-binding outer membrane lipoprotein [Sphingobacterium sp. Ka21]|uniref:SusD/RagB family nutrient-binding outer membrane lipoprotein n=2 Tax=Sphingobacterium pedocola TaxID=2082722 RepID=A0ABR9T3R0_9SPHI|nr:SusD/RagB family nutrient-binding outer membrane lipoprotein [Sphingobacterium pedocola]